MRDLRQFKVIDSSKSTAVEFLAWCAGREELYVINRGSTKLYVYVNVRGDAIEEIERSDSIGRSLVKLRRSGLHSATPQEVAAGIAHLRSTTGPHFWLRFPDDSASGGSYSEEVSLDESEWFDESEDWLDVDEQTEDSYLDSWDIAEIDKDWTFRDVSVDDTFDSDSRRPLWLPFVDLRGAELEGRSLENANLEGSMLDRVSLTLANLSKAFLFSASLTDAVLDYANLESAYLVGAQLQRAQMIGANLRGANLVGANLSATNLRGADLRGANVTAESLAQANLTDSWLPDSFV